MSRLQRYRADWAPQEWDTGGWVKYEEVAALEAENADLKERLGTQGRTIGRFQDDESGEVARLRGALESVRVYGSDTLSGRIDGPADAAWLREGVKVMRDRAKSALAEGGSDV